MIRQFDVVPNPNRAWRTDKPYLLNVQHDFLFDSKTRVLAVLVIPGSVKTTPRLYPQFEVLGQGLNLTPDELVTIETRRLGKPVANLEAERYRILAALDLVFAGI